VLLDEGEESAICWNTFSYEIHGSTSQNYSAYVIFPYSVRHLPCTARDRREMPLGMSRGPGDLQKYTTDMNIHKEYNGKFLLWTRDLLRTPLSVHCSPARSVLECAVYSSVSRSVLRWVWGFSRVYSKRIIRGLCISFNNRAVVEELWRGNADCWKIGLEAAILLWTR
jgi:hypothetical protein